MSEIMDVLLHDSTICRLCAEENSNGILIFNNKESESDISHLINKYMPLKISDDGKYPCTICPGCNIQLEATMQFLDLVIAGQAKLREIYKKQQEELKQLQKLNEKKVPNYLQAIVVEQENGQKEEIRIFQILPDGSIYSSDHEQFLKAEGLEKPRKKRGRPSKQSLLQENNTTVPEKPKEDESVVEETEQETVDGRKRRRKVPSRFKEAVQGKELERIFREEGVIDENDSSGDDDEDTVEKDSSIIIPTSSNTKTEVIGHLETQEGQDLGEIVVVNRFHKSRHRRFRRRRFRYNCDICGKSFQHLGRYNFHKAAHKDFKFECTTCQASFESKQELLDHHNDTKHTGESLLEILPEKNDDGGNETETTTPSKFQCKQCSKTFVTKQGYEVHLKGVHEKQRPFTCQVCGKTFAYTASLKTHLLSHEMKANKGYPCDICGKILNHPSSIIYHKQSEHNNGRRFVCNKCNKSFKHKQLLQRHQLVHSNARPFDCKTCGAQFKAKSNLLNHQLTHSGVKKFFCELCGQQFAHKTSLTLHYRWHSGQKPFQCVFCEKSFSQNGNLQEHIRIHTGVKPYCCDYCGHKFTTSSQFKLHVKRHTGERPWSCVVCQKKFLSKETWRNHSRRHFSEKPYTCSVCNRGFVEQLALKKHHRTHTGEKPYVCDICKRAFSDCSNLSKHKKIHSRAATTFLNDEEIWNKVDELDDEYKQDAEQSVEAENNDEVGQIYYVTYNEPDNDNNSSKTTVQLVEDLEGNVKDNGILYEKDPLNAVDGENLDQQTVEINGIDFTSGQLQVTDEDGNPINFTIKDGHQLHVTTFDGEHLQVTAPDGSIIPIELNIENDQSKDESIKIGEDETIQIADEHQTIEFLTQNGLKVELITPKSKVGDTEYLTVV